MPKQLPILPGQRPAFRSVMDKAIERVSKLDPKSIKLRATEAEKLVAEKLPVAWSLPAGPAYSCPGATADCAACVSGDTLILVRGEGLVRIDALVGRDIEVWSGHDWRRTTAVLTSEAAPTMAIETNFGLRLRCTPDHRILSAGEWIPAEALSVGDALDSTLPEDTPWPAQAALPFGARTTRLQEWTYEFGVFLGYIMGNGTVTRGPYPTIAICGHADDRQDLERLREIVTEWVDTHTQVYERVVPPNRFAPHGGSTCNVAWRVKALSEAVLAVGLDKSAAPELRRVPLSLFTASEAAVRGFVSGMFSTDGCVQVSTSRGKPRYTLTLASVSKPLLLDVQQLLAGFGIRATICEYAASNASRIADGYRALHKLDISSADSVRRFHERIGFFNGRKQARLAEGIPLIASTQARRHQPVVTAIATGELEPVYDLVNVGEEHQFVANGLTVHNCYAQQGRHYYPNVAEKLARNWRRFRWMEEHQTPTQAAREIVRDVISPILPLFRIHESGDFHSQWAVDVWTQVIAMKPMTAFWSYTRSFQLDFSRLVALPNVRLYASTDSQNLGAARAFVAKHDGRVAHAFGPYVPGARLPARSYECPPTADKHLVKLGKNRKEFGLSGACIRCKACIPFTSNEKPRHIVFYSHYLSQATTGYPEDEQLEGLGALGSVRSSIGRAVMAPGLGPGCMVNSANPFHFP